MRRSTRTLAAVALLIATVLIATQYTRGERTASAKATAPSKEALTADNLPRLHQLIRPQPGEFKWDAVPWYASIWHARKAAAAEDKPIFFFGTGGAGFNDPLGNC